MPMTHTRKRPLFATAFLATVALGMASRKFPTLFPAILGKYPGDALWAIMAFFAWGFVMPNFSAAKLAMCSLATSYADEFSQIYQANWINEIRRTSLGHLVLGSTFSWFDMLAYTVGVGALIAGQAVLKLLRIWPPKPTPAPSSPEPTTP